MCCSSRMPTAINSSRRAQTSRCLQQGTQFGKVASWFWLCTMLLLGLRPCIVSSGLESSTVCSDPSSAACLKAGHQPNTSAQGQHDMRHDTSSSSSSSRKDLYDAHAAAISSKAEQQVPHKSSADKGGYVEFLLFVSDPENIPTFQDQQFGPVVIPVMPPSNDHKQQQQQQQQQEPWQLGPAGDMMRLLAQHKAQFLVSVGDQTHFKFLQQLPAQFRQKTFHADGPEQMTVDAVESFFWKAIRAPLGGTTFEPLLSLFTPAYKSGTKIHIPYESLLKQSYQNWEWVIYDDSPPEHTETWRELSALRDKDVRVRVYKSDRNDAFIGSVKAKACHMAVGQLLIELDHDDTLTPDALELLKDALVANPDAGFFYTEAIELYEGTQDTVDYGKDWAFGQGAHYNMLYNGFWATGAIAPPFNEKTLRHIVGVPNHVRAWSRKAYVTIGGHTRGLPVADDYDLILRTLFKYPAVYIRHMTYIQYRQLDGGTFTFIRNALIQRLVDILGRHSNPRIQKLLAGNGMADGGWAALHDYELVWDDATPTGPPLARYYHKPTITAAKDQPYITVIIPTYNNTKQLQRAIGSVFAQDYANWELLIVGDHCPELDAFMEQHKQAILDSGHTVRYYNMHERGGPGLHAPLNLAAKLLAPSDWIAYLRDDAVWTPDHLKSLAAKIAAVPQSMYVFASVSKDGKVVIANKPQHDQLDMSAVAHHRRLIENYGGWKSQAAVGSDNAWEFFSRWNKETWGATLQATVLYGHSAAVVEQQQQQHRTGGDHHEELISTV